MKKPIRIRLTRTITLVITVTTVLCGSCVMRPWRPTNVGRENGAEKTPWMVSHLPERNKWAMDRTGPHIIFQHVLCFNYACRKMIGRRKALGSTSYKQFVKEIKKNAKRGAYKNMTPVVPVAPSIKKQIPNVPVIAKETVLITKVQPAPVLTAPVLKADSLITLSEFLFEFDSYKLKDKHYAQLDSLSQFLLAYPALEARITGHTDNTGNERHNVTLSMRRAETVALYLINKGVPDEKIFFEGLGSTRPIRSNETEEGRSKNRRVEILISNTKRK
jgi:outer membrane protein OmpA-like peptidoglycan-associated protein